MRIIQFSEKMWPLKQKLFTAVMMGSAMLLPGTGFSQEPGSNPDVPLNGQGVPFDSTMNITLLLVGVVFAVYKIRKAKKADLVLPSGKQV